MSRNGNGRSSTLFGGPPPAIGVTAPPFPLVALRPRSATTSNNSARDQPTPASNSDDADNSDDESELPDEHPASPLSSNPKTTCIICHEDMGDRETPVTLKCGHILGSVCMNAWLHIPGRQHKCPMCRMELFKAPQIDNADGSDTPAIFGEMDNALNEQPLKRPQTPIGLQFDSVYHAAKTDADRQGKLFREAWTTAKCTTCIASKIEHLADKHSSGGSFEMHYGESRKCLETNGKQWRDWQTKWEEIAKQKYLAKKRADELVLTVAANRGLLQEYVGPSSGR